MADPKIIIWARGMALKWEKDRPTMDEDEVNYGVIPPLKLCEE